MPRALQVVPPLPNLHTALERFLARSRFAARTRERYAQDLAPLVAQHGQEPVTSLTHRTTAVCLAAQEHLAASPFNRRYAALRSFVGWCQQQGWLDDVRLTAWNAARSREVARGRWIPSRSRPRYAPSALRAIAHCSG